MELHFAGPVPQEGDYPTELEGTWEVYGTWTEAVGRYADVHHMLSHFAAFFLELLVLAASPLLLEHASAALLLLELVVFNLGSTSFVYFSSTALS